MFKIWFFISLPSLEVVLLFLFSFQLPCGSTLYYSLCSPFLSRPKIKFPSVFFTSCYPRSRLQSFSAVQKSNQGVSGGKSNPCKPLDFLPVQSVQSVSFAVFVVCSICRCGYIYCCRWGWNGLIPHGRRSEPDSLISISFIVVKSLLDDHRLFGFRMASDSQNFILFPFEMPIPVKC